MCLHSTVQTSQVVTRSSVLILYFIQMLASLVMHMHSHHISFLQFIVIKL